MKIDNNQQVFFTLLRAGLWEKEVRVSCYKTINFSEVFQFASEQSVVGLIAAGLEYVADLKPATEDVIPFVGQAFQLEQKNLAMNDFVSSLTIKLKNNRIVPVLMKGQGIAQNYERPLWRSCGDVDLLFDEKNYHKAKDYLTPLASSIDEEDKTRLHFVLHINSWVVELHGTMRGGWSKTVDNLIDEVQDEMLKNDETRVWQYGGTDILLPSPDNDLIFVFTHILQHYFIEGIGLRQICDWCRLLFRYSNCIDVQLLDSRLCSADLKPKWQAFASLAVEWLGMPAESMPLYSPERKLTRKAKRIMYQILETGNFGQKRDVSYKDRYPFMIRLAISFSRHTRDFWNRLFVFPIDSIRIWWKMMMRGTLFAIKQLSRL